ncbi:rhodanese-like domain-containing protein [Nicoliella spurrieriana]|uniref:Rhodanese-like domain-containing protein n=1 Tax=Nicoliella spurrieriana TaxID=2925830 RepID=A0A976RS84_9LACO|nr:rhodanese-like domain-containing protein [Nicoliella spurrieriana]UQS86676.1 rhodanese-like domain-containing protein [Nicoliella spurrieriana]
MSFLITVLVIVIVWGGWLLFNRYRLNQVATLIDENQFTQLKRRAQIIDLREKRDFDAGHILGARSVPYSTLKQLYGDIRSDLPVILYDQGQTLSSRAASFLHKKGYPTIYVLKSGYRNWNGKTKKRDA